MKICRKTNYLHFVNLRLFATKVADMMENDQEIYDTVDHNFKNVLQYVIS